MVNEKNNNQDKDRILSNREIRAREVRLIESDGSQAGVMPFFAALNRATEQDLDLILINSVAYPPVCKIGDAGKYKYAAQKRRQEQEKKNRENRVDIKEVQIRPQIDTHDLNIKINKIKEWIEDGDKVKIVIRFRGREMSNQEVGYRLVNSIIEAVPFAKIDGQTELQGNRLTTLLSKNK